MNDPTLARAIKEQFKSEFMHPFPIADVGKLRSVDSKNLGQFHGELDLYFSLIAGYASDADRLGRRSQTELIEARKKLSQSFFEKYRSLAGYRDAITQSSTPNLFRDLSTADKLRKELLVVLDQLLGPEPALQK